MVKLASPTFCIKKLAHTNNKVTLSYISLPDDFDPRSEQHSTSMLLIVCTGFTLPQQFLNSLLFTQYTLINI